MKPAESHVSILDPVAVTACLSKNLNFQLNVFVLERLGPEFHHWACEATGDLSLLPLNWSDFSPKRRLDFLRGRYAAHQVLTQLYELNDLSDLKQVNQAQWDGPILKILPSGAAAFPQNVAGSISHSDTASCAVATLDRCFVGVDVEDLSHAKTAHESRSEYVFSRDVMLQSVSPEYSDTLLFSAKESVYKALSPRFESNSKWINFDHVTIQGWNETEQSFSFTLERVNTQSEKNKIEVLFSGQGFYSFTDAFVFTVVCAADLSR